MTAIAIVVESAPRAGSLRRALAEPGARAFALSEEVEAAIRPDTGEESFPEYLREDHLIYPADERAARWAEEVFRVLHSKATPALTHRAIDMDLMLEGRLTYYFFRRLALLYTKLEAIADRESPSSLVFCSSDPLLVRMARSLAARRGMSARSLPAAPRRIALEKEELRRRPALKNALALAREAAHAVLPRTLPATPPGAGPIVLFAESNWQVDFLAPVFEELQRRGPHSILVIHRPDEVRRHPRFSGAYAPLDRYLTPAGYGAVIEAARSAARFSSRALGAGSIDPAFEWREIAPEIRREIAYAAVPFTAGLIERVHAIAHRHHPRLGITVSEMGAFAQTIARAGRSAGMASLNMEHGIKTHLAMVERVISDKIAAFGEHTKEVLVSRGADPASVVLTGSPRYDALFRREGLRPKQEIARALGLDEACPWIVFASYPLGISGTHTGPHKEALIRALAEAVDAEPAWAFAVKLHPLEKDGIARALLEGRPKRRFRVIGEGEVPLYSLLASADVLATFTSTTALEAAILEKPVLVVNFSGLEDRAPYVPEGIALAAERPEEVAPALRALLEDPATKNRLEENRKRFKRRFAYDGDGGATVRVADLIEEMIASPRAGRDQGKNSSSQTAYER